MIVCLFDFHFVDAAAVVASAVFENDGETAIEYAASNLFLLRRRHRNTLICQSIGLFSVLRDILMTP